MNENPESSNRVPVADLAVDALFGVPTHAGKWRWRCSSMLPWQDVDVFASKFEDRLIVVMPDSGACHYLTSHPASEWGGPSSPNTKVSHDGA
jgi:hypothetical protein